MDTGDGAPRLITADFVSGNGFEVLGMNAYLGRLLTPADDVRGGPAEGWPVVLGYGFWKDDFGGDPSILGKQIKVSNTAVTVVGVARPNFRGVRPDRKPSSICPSNFLPSSPVMTSMRRIRAAWGSAIGRLKPGVSVEQARAELATYEKTLISEFIPLDLRDRFQARNAYLWVSSARTGLPTFFGQVYSTPLYLMQGLVGIVLLLCCVNVAGLMMSKVYSRRQEFAIRTAIGAARWRLIRQYLTESFVIALAGAALGAAAAWYGTGYLLPFFRHPNEGIGLSITPDATVLIVTGFFAVLTTLLFGTLPAWRAGAADPGYLLKSRTASGRRRRILGRAFIPLQVALSFALVSIATLLSQSLIRLETEQTGFDLDHVTIQTAPFHLLNVSLAARMELYHRMKNRLEQLPGINSASFTLLTPMTSFQLASGFQAASSGPNPPEDPRMPYNHVGPGYFRTMKTAILQGREFQDNERDSSVCVLNQSAAAYLFPRQPAIGQYVRSTDEKRFPQPVACRVVGLAQDAKFANLHEPPPRTIYFPVQVETLRNTNLVIPAERADQSAGDRRLSHSKVRAFARHALRPLRHAARADGSRARQPACSFADEQLLRRAGSISQRIGAIRAVVVERRATNERNRCPHGAGCETRPSAANDSVGGARTVGSRTGARRDCAGRDGEVRGRNALRSVRLRSAAARRDHRCPCPGRDHRRPVARAARCVRGSNSSSARRVNGRPVKQERMDVLKIGWTLGHLSLSGDAA